MHQRRVAIFLKCMDENEKWKDENIPFHGFFLIMRIILCELCGWKKNERMSYFHSTNFCELRELHFVAERRWKMKSEKWKMKDERWKISVHGSLFTPHVSRLTVRSSPITTNDCLLPLYDSLLLALAFARSQVSLFTPPYSLSTHPASPLPTI